MDYIDDCKRALEIAKRSRTHREAIEKIIKEGLAEDIGEADALIREGENMEKK